MEGEPVPPLPLQPPQGEARPATLLDVEPQIIVAQQADGAVIWVRGAVGWSAPVLCHVARPFWISRERAVPGQIRLLEEVQQARLVISVDPFTIYEDPGNPAALETVRRNLADLWKLLQAYDAAHGGLPQAAFFPDDPPRAVDSLVTLLSEEARPLLLHPIAGRELRQIALHYVWNERLSGRRLATLSDPARTWLLMDIFGTHDFLVLAGHAGWDGKVPVLFADGHVALRPPPRGDGDWSWNAWAEAN